VIEGQVPILIVRPGMAIVLFVLAWQVLGLPADAHTALLSYLSAGIVALLVCGAMLLRRRPVAMRTHPPAVHARAWLSAAIPITVMTGLYIGNGRVGTILLGSLTGPEAAGIYALALRGADRVMFALVAVNTALSPTFAALHAKEDVAGLQRVVTQGARLIFALALPVAAFMLLLGHVFLGIFGAEFVAGATALRILVLGQLVNVLMGPVGVLLVMAGRERLAMYGFAAGLVSNLALAAMLIPAYGVEGAAWAATVSMVVWNVVLGVLTARSLGVGASVLGAPLGGMRTARG
jgi:O-antigen/teichoic acid export membrane protein